MRPARVTAIEVADTWAALAMLERLIATDDPMELRPWNEGRLYPYEIHAFVKSRVKYIHGKVQRWASMSRTLAGGYGDCGNSARVVIGLARFHGYRARLRVFLRTEREAGILGRPYKSVAHVCAQIADEGGWRWAECVVDAEFGEHPLAAARRLGMNPQIEEVPPPEARAGKLARPVGGPWPYGADVRRFPLRVTALGRMFTRASMAWPFYPGVLAQYREDLPRASLHMMVTRGRWTVTHADAVNPDRGSALEHLARDVITRPRGVTIGAMQLPPTKTPVSPQDQYQALYDAWTASRSDTPTGAQLLILLAQWALETGWVAGAPASTGQIQWAVGNVKHTAGDGADWTTYLTTEYQGGQPVKVMQDFKAYPDLSSATADYFRRFQPGGPNAGAFAYVQTADPAGFVHALAQERYFTAPESSYLAGLKGRLAALEALNLAPPSSGPSGPAVAGALVLVGLGVGYAVRNGWIDPSRLAHLF